MKEEGIGDRVAVSRRRWKREIEVGKGRRDKDSGSIPALGGDGGIGFTASFFLATTGDVLGDLLVEEGLVGFNTCVALMLMVKEKGGGEWGEIKERRMGRENRHATATRLRREMKFNAMTLKFKI